MEVIVKRERSARRDLEGAIAMCMMTGVQVDRRALGLFLPAR